MAVVSLMADMAEMLQAEDVFIRNVSKILENKLLNLKIYNSFAEIIKNTILYIRTVYFFAIRLIRILRNMPGSLLIMMSIMIGAESLLRTI